MLQSFVVPQWNPHIFPPKVSFQAVFASQRQTEASRRREQNEEDSALMTHLRALGAEKCSAFWYRETMGNN